MDTYLGPRESWGFWMLQGTERQKRQHMRERLERAGLRPTPQRMRIGLWVFEPPTKHFTPEDLFRVIQADATTTGANPISLATIYNTLNAFADSGMLRMATIASGKRYFDTNTTPHYHLFDCDGVGLIDVPRDLIDIDFKRDLPEGFEIDSVVVTLRIKPGASEDGDDPSSSAAP